MAHRIKLKKLGLLRHEPSPVWGFVCYGANAVCCKIFKGKGLKAGASLGEVYDAVTGTGYRKGTQAYELNRVWDTNKNGVIEKGESVKSGAFKNHIKNFFLMVSVRLILAKQKLMPPKSC